MSGTEFRKLHYWNASYYSFRFISLGRFNRFLPRLVQMASFGAGYTTKGALLLSAYDRCRKACFPLHSHTGFLREELQCFCVHASFLLLSAKNISNQINIQAEKVTGHRSCLTKSFPWWVLDQGNYFQLQNFVFFFSFWPASTLILSYGDCVTITILSWHNWGPIEQNQSLTSSLNDGSNFFSTCVTWKTTCTIIYTPNSLPIYIDSMLTLPT